MQLSIIIVNYNVKYFVEQCLISVSKALKNIDAEVFVVDNNSVDGSCEMIRTKFEWVKLIENKKNHGFSYANNQAIRISQGKYVLLLNPDTVVEENSFDKVLTFMDSNPEAGGLGVKMIDGKGNFLPESKRSLPTPEVAFYKIFGFSSLFPKSKIFSKYHLGYLDKDKIHEVEVLSGAFMLLRKETLEKTGLLDESFFMYGEDIDMSYRVLLAGYKNFYFPETTIIHYKGESTKKSSVNYVVVFYNAMIIFAQKHFSQKRKNLFSFIIQFAIYFRAFLSILRRFLAYAIFPVIDATIIFIGFWIIKPFWEHFMFNTDNYYPKEFFSIAVPTYILVWIVSIFISNGYKKPVKVYNLFKGILLGTFSILVVYALLSEAFRFSRAIILIGAVWVFISLILSRYLMNLLPVHDFKIASNRKTRTLIFAKEAEADRIENLVNQSDINLEIVEKAFPIEIIDNEVNNESLVEIIEINKIEEIIFSSKDISSESIIKTMLSLSNLKVNYKIAPPESLSVIGSNSIHTSGDLYILEINSISKQINRKQKRVFDILMSLFLLLTSFLWIFFVRNKSVFFSNCIFVLKGKLSWVGYHLSESLSMNDLPRIKQGVFNPVSILKQKNLSIEKIVKINTIYAKNYKITNDLIIVLRALISFSL